MRFVVSVDGSCKGAGKAGGWTFTFRDHKRSKFEWFAGAKLETSNNEMELTALYESLKYLTEKCDIGTAVTVVCDSKYVLDGYTKWKINWKNNNWCKSSDNKPIKFRDIWIAIDEMGEKFDLDFVWVPGHTGHPDNEVCDDESRKAMLALMESTKNEEV